MANPHFAKFADIWKHLPLLAVLRIERPTRYWETHAGTAFYPLTPSPEREYGIYHFLENVERFPALAGSAYRSVLAGLPHRDGLPIRYPGSATLAMLALGVEATYLLCDKDLTSADDLENAAEMLGLQDRVKVVREDGPSTIQDAYEDLPPAATGDVVCHIDPFNSFTRALGGPSSIELFERLAAGGITTVYWYAYEGADERGWLRSQLSHDTHAWFGDVLLPERDESGLIGLGVALANATPATIERCTALGRALERMYENARLPSGAHGSIDFATFEGQTPRV